jgi:FG-GAP-like repeat
MRMPRRQATVAVALAALACSGGTPVPAPPGSVPAPTASYGTPQLLWSGGGCTAGGCQTGWYASPAVADLDGDGHPEVVWGGQDLVALDAATGTLRWRAPGAARIWPSPAVADLDGDGKLEIVVGRGSDELTVYASDGTKRWTQHPFGAGEVRTLALGDLDGSGKLSIVVGRAADGQTRQVSAYSASGALLPGWPARRDGEPGNGAGVWNENAAVADLDGDGKAEVVAPTDTHYVTVLDGGGNQLPVNPVYGAGKVWSEVGVHVDQAADLRGFAICGTEHRPNFSDSAPVVADLDGDGVPEIVVVGNVYDCSTTPYTSLYHMPFVLRRDRTRWSAGAFDWTVLPSPLPGSRPRSEDFNVVETAMPNAVVADLDGDGAREILFASYDGKVHAVSLDKSEPFDWPFTIPGPGIRFASEPVVADLDGDGKAEVLFTSWPDKATGGVGRLHVLDYRGRQVYAVDLPPATGGSWNGALGAPTLARLDAAGDLVAFVGTAHAGLAAYRIPGSAAGRILWGTGRGSLLRNGTPPSARP